MTKKIGHISMAILLLVSTMGLTVHMHFCNNRLFDFAVFSNAKDCCTATLPVNSVSDNNNNNSQFHCCRTIKNKMDGCKDETYKMNEIDNFVISSFDLDLKNLSFIHLFLSTHILSDFYKLQNTLIVKIPAGDISPPGIKVFLSLLQTYLI